ncbi:MAG: hypothetical protein QOG01_4309 [Pseudonocardiales bacterium]|jgi:uncharacterized protein YndB with AHSA1/START domain|nr:hypothetical protein [Pseudonocardiales bacterium]
MSVVHDTFRIERSYPAAPERVFAAWASQSAKSQWFGEDDAATDEHTLDFQVGGRERMSGKVPDGPTFSYDAVYEDIVDNERAVWSYSMHLNGRRISVSVATLEITGVPGGTSLVLTEQGAYLDGLDTSAAREEGTNQILDKLGDVLAANG